MTDKRYQLKHRQVRRCSFRQVDLQIHVRRCSIRRCFQVDCIEQRCKFLVSSLISQCRLMLLPKNINKYRIYSSFSYLPDILRKMSTFKAERVWSKNT
jgi:hypothetical protein